MARALRRLASGAVVLALSFCGRATAAETARPASAPAVKLGSAKPMHIMSMNLCTDLLLLQMVPRSRIATVTFLAHDAVNDLFPGADAGVAVNLGTSEDVIEVKPDLILGGDYSTHRILKLAARAIHAPLIEVKPAENFDDIRATIRQVGVAVGEPARAEAMIQRMDATLAQLSSSPLPRPMRVVAWSGGSAVPGKGTLTDAIIAAAGGVNIAAQPGALDGTFSVEQLIFAHPDALLFGGERSGTPSLHADEGQHRLVRELYGERRIDYDDIAHECGLPQSADSARSIHRALLALPTKRPSH